MSTKNTNNLLIITLILALILRLIGINHSLPFIFHPDEPTIIRSALGIRFGINPGHFDWPHLYIYLNYFIYMGFSFIREIMSNYLVSVDIKILLSILWDDSSIFYLITRVLTALFGVFTVVPIYFSAKKVFNERAGFFAALLFALFPFHIRHSHYSLIDAPMVFFLAWSLYFSLSILIREERNDYGGAGIYSGLSASTKYNGAFSLFGAFYAHLLRVIENKEKVFRVKALGFLSLTFFMFWVGFLVGTPFAALDFKTFSRTDGPKGAFWQFTNVGSIPFSQRPSQFVNEMIHRVNDDLGNVVLPIFFLTFLYSSVILFMKKPAEYKYSLFYLTSFGALLLLYVSGFQRPRSHYYMIAYPYIALVVGWALNVILTFLYKRSQTLSFIFMLVVFASPAYFSFKTTYIFANKDTRILLYEWIMKNASSSTVYYNTDEFNEVADYIERKSNASLTKINNSTIPLGSYYLAVTDDYPINESILNGNSQKTIIFDPSFRNGPKITVYLVRNNTVQFN